MEKKGMPKQQKKDLSFILFKTLKKRNGMRKLATQMLLEMAIGTDKFFLSSTSYSD